MRQGSRILSKAFALSALLPVQAWASCVFNGTDAQLSNLSAVPHSAAGFTMVAWVQPDANDIVDEIVHLYNTTNTTNYFSLWIAGNESIVGTSRSSGGAEGNATGGTATNGSWQMISATIATTSSRFAGKNGVNGTENTTSVTPANAPNAMRIGVRPSAPTVWYAGKVGLVVTYGSALTEMQLAEISAEGPYDASTAASIAHDWDMRSACGATVTDGVGTVDLTNNNATHSSDNPTFAPAFTSGPSEAPATNGFTISGTITGTGTLVVEAVGVNPGAPAPSCTQVKAGQDGNGTAAPLNASETWTTGVSNDFLLTASGAWPRYDVHVCGTNGTTDTAVTSLTDQDRSPDTNQSIVPTTSLDATSFLVRQTATGCDSDGTTALLTGCSGLGWLIPGMRVDLSAGGLTDEIVECAGGSDSRCEADEVLLVNIPTMQSDITLTEENGVTPNPAIGDVIEGDDENSEGDTLTWGADGTLDCAAPCTATYWTATLNVQDVSDTSDGDFDTGYPAWTSGDLTIHVNSSRPEISTGGPFPDTVYLEVGEAYSSAVLVSDPDSQAVTCADRTTPPSGMDITDNALAGTPDTEDLSGWSFTLDCVDSGGLYASPVTVSGFTFDGTVTMIDVVGLDLTEEGTGAIDTLLAEYPWMIGAEITARFVCSPTAPLGEVVAHDPEAMEEREPFAAIVLDVSAGVCSSGSRRIGVSIGVGL